MWNNTLEFSKLIQIFDRVTVFCSLVFGTSLESGWIRPYSRQVRLFAFGSLADLITAEFVYKIETLLWGYSIKDHRLIILGQHTTDLLQFLIRWSRFYYYALVGIALFETAARGTTLHYFFCDGLHWTMLSILGLGEPLSGRCSNLFA